MSRTDSHAPFHVRVARREVPVHAAHRCAGGGCECATGPLPVWTTDRLFRLFSGSDVSHFFSGGNRWWFRQQPMRRGPSRW